MSCKKYGIKGNLNRIVQNPSKEQLQKRISDAKRRKRNRKYVDNECKRRGGCEFCGIILHHRVYEWHHIWDHDKTNRLISEMMGRYKLQDFDEEFKKVVMLCPTCHVIFHKDLCCMIDHKYYHINGTFFQLGIKNSEKIIDYEYSPSNSILKFCEY